MSMVPESHPRYKSLLNRGKVVDAFESGVLAKGGLIAHGRGETYDYLIGETTPKVAKEAIKASAAMLMLAKNPVISVNGNSIALAKDELIDLAAELNGKIEVNLFYRTEAREQKIKELFEKNESNNENYKNNKITILGIDDANKQMPNVDHLRGKVSEAGIYTADVVLVPLEDGDRAEALIEMGKKVIAIDLNPLSRTAQKSTITIVDELTRCIPLIKEEIINLKKQNLSNEELNQITKFDNNKALNEILKLISDKLTNK
ncbi:4-phosphopantoate--beta-alanine ligase [Methanococcus voltae PS]|uniref:4-phosphopantoate--beta-alanine ligase n=1 Tax=Methanococcus voltae PS TaxID=523842 RepID=A0ABT2EWC9_METVO|nr:4-phosphopantoate--beta-alanine ligase [Methanococcus voltae]MCS3922170.1 4-phosphopantoate--beta-alanine ligase [Methanococcus voltae PS]